MLLAKISVMPGGQAGVSAGAGSQAWQAGTWSAAGLSATHAQRGQELMSDAAAGPDFPFRRQALGRLFIAAARFPCSQ
ncbi:MAG TPA: hypothetical protein VFI23_06285, partial [Rhizomicrobium sp.]|nr:hypothetical protein [Rhizomicrobium sp.]